MDRYLDKPFLRLIECYILKVIDQIDDDRLEALQRMEPKLIELYGINGTWFDIVNDQMGFPESLPLKIREVWENYLVSAKKQNMTIDPDEFAVIFVDQNFPDIVS